MNGVARKSTSHFATGRSHGIISRQRANTLFRRAVTSILSQRLLRKITDARAVFMGRIHVFGCQNLASILLATFVKCIHRNIRCALMELALELKFHLDFHRVTPRQW